jgi:hypothetical protein
MPPPEPGLVDQLRGGAAPVDAGRFRIDANRALEKLRRFRLADPHHYVLELIRAAVASRARWVEVRTDADDFELGFDGDPFPPGILKELLAQALLGGDDRDARRARLLSLGVAGALALQPRWVRVQSGEWRVELDGGAMATTARAPALEPPQRTFIHVRERLSWRVARDALLGSREAKVIADFCRELPIPLTLNGKALGPARSFDEPMLARVQQEKDGVRLWAAFPRRRLTQSLVRFHLHGVQICERRWDGPTRRMPTPARRSCWRRTGGCWSCCPGARGWTWRGRWRRARPRSSTGAAGRRRRRRSSACPPAAPWRARW